MSDSLWPDGLQRARLPCPSLSPGVWSNSCPLSQWCHPTILSSDAPFSSYLQSFPASGSFPVSQLFASGGQCIWASTSASVLSVNIQDWFPLGLTSLMSLQSRALSRVFSNTTVQKHQFFGAQLSLWSNSHIHAWLLGKPSKSKWLKWSCSVVSDSLRPVDCSLPGSSVHGIPQARVLEWVAISFSRGSSQCRDRTQVSRNCRQTLTVWIIG